MVELGTGPVQGFRPRSAADYIRRLRDQPRRRTRAHEALVGRFEADAISAGFETHSPHPQDLVLVRGRSLWLVEGQDVSRGDVTERVHEVLVELLEYRHFLYAETGLGEPDGLVALFTDEIGEAFVSFLDSLGIATVWWGATSFEGSERAARDGLVVAQAA